MPDDFTAAFSLQLGVGDLQRFAEIVSAQPLDAGQRRRQALESCSVLRLQQFLDFLKPLHVVEECEFPPDLHVPELML